MIYFLQADGGEGPIIIGCVADACSLKSKLSSHKSHYGEKRIVLALILGDMEEAAKLLERFHHLQVSRRSFNGKWPKQFRPGPDLLEFIAKLPIHPWLESDDVLYGTIRISRDPKKAACIIKEHFSAKGIDQLIANLR